jgi:hypothetical protein
MREEFRTRADMGPDPTKKPHVPNRGGANFSNLRGPPIERPRNA